ncbi:MAG: 50S ribosomal protein L18 [Candidatus Korarchaeota archaeon NZ13-K]|nr:MAG: 50S ribosomal protein L18 [Candidatus Korarchaeota archaeon NZ13-K]
MARSGRYKVKFRRRREGKTDYLKRLALLKSRKPRVVVRRTNRYVIVQFVRFREEGDEVMAYAFSKELERYGWIYGGKNLPAAYLTGYLAGLRARKAGISEAILDIGRFPSTRGSRLYAALKGVLDAGVEVPHSDEILPDEERIRGEHISSFASKLKEEDRELLERQFSDYLRRGADPKMIPEVFERVLEEVRANPFRNG